MTGDFSRWTFDPERHFRAVLMQQGRALLDTTNNEQAAILLHYIQTLATDLIGPHGGPHNDWGFQIITDPSDAEQVAPDMLPPLKALWAKKAKNDVLIGPGHYYVNGILCVNEEYSLYSTQPDFVNPLALPDPGVSSVLLYLDVWERHITAHEDDCLREVALGGPDTATRLKTIWQVKAKTLDPGQTADDGINLLSTPRLALLQAMAKQDPLPTDACIIPANARYRGPENQLYRVEIQRGGSVSTDLSAAATYKFSRENGSVIFPIVSSTGSSIALEHLGYDQRYTLQEKDWVEVLDDELVLKGESGQLLQVSTVNRLDMTVTLTVPQGVDVPVYDENSTTHPLLRRWDQKGSADTGGALPVKEGTTENAWLVLEDGVRVRFTPGGTYRAGDYWLIPTRTATGDVEWPQEVSASGVIQPAALPPLGIVHQYAPLAVLMPGVQLPEEHRNFFDNLVQVTKRIP